jgi:hypothetical protein
MQARAHARRFWQNVAADVAMKPWKKCAAINVGALIGIGLSLLVVPPNTPFWLWLAISIATIAIVNFFLYRRLKKPPGALRPEPLPMIIVWICTAFFLLDVIFHLLHR